MVRRYNDSDYNLDLEYFRNVFTDTNFVRATDFGKVCWSSKTALLASAAEVFSLWARQGVSLNKIQREECLKRVGRAHAFDPAFLIEQPGLSSVWSHGEGVWYFASSEGHVVKSDQAPDAAATFATAGSIAPIGTIEGWREELALLIKGQLPFTVGVLAYLASFVARYASLRHNIVIDLIVDAHADTDLLRRVCASAEGNNRYPLEFRLRSANELTRPLIAAEMIRSKDQLIIVNEAHLLANESTERVRDGKVHQLYHQFLSGDRGISGENGEFISTSVLTIGTATLRDENKQLADDLGRRLISTEPQPH